MTIIGSNDNDNNNRIDYNRIDYKTKNNGMSLFYLDTIGNECLLGFNLILYMLKRN